MRDNLYYVLINVLNIFYEIHDKLDMMTNG